MTDRTTAYTQLRALDDFEARRTAAKELLGTLEVVGMAHYDGAHIVPHETNGEGDSKPADKALCGRTANGCRPPQLDQQLAGFDDPCSDCEHVLLQVKAIIYSDDPAFTQILQMPHPQLVVELLSTRRVLHATSNKLSEVIDTSDAAEQTTESGLHLPDTNQVLAANTNQKD